VCCSSGSLPNLTPKPGADGSCASYTIQSGDYCVKIAATYQITVDQIEQYNKKTWGWNGCDLLWANSNICLSTGSPPMPASVWVSTLPSLRYCPCSQRQHINNSPECRVRTDSSKHDKAH
jgi:hypothetical protein